MDDEAVLGRPGVVEGVVVGICCIDESTEPSRPGHFRPGLSLCNVISTLVDYHFAFGGIDGGEERPDGECVDGGRS